MKSQSSSARIEFASPEIKVGLDAARGNKKPKVSQPMEAPAMPKNKKLLMPGAPEAVAEKRNPNPAKKLMKLPKRKK